MSRVKNKLIFAMLFWMVALSYPLSAEEINSRRALDNYIMLCQGCHLPDASGVPGKVPSIKGFASHFLRVEGGREFLVRVPGSANAAVNDAELTELLNWMLTEFSGRELPPDYQPFLIDEVAALRKNPLTEVVELREKLVAEIAELGFVEPTSD